MEIDAVVIVFNQRIFAVIITVKAVFVFFFLIFQL
ncbi:hypothetical protein FVB9288_01106 [Flavobacterium sp. CECT 9288]|nr:hypothetical protein FVB9288_01106 [Flavobacterium sp. CECT 9288]